MELLFSYGTLQQASIQLNVFGRLLVGELDQLSGFRLSKLDIKDQVNFATTSYPVVVFTDSPHDVVSGTVYQLSSSELLRADLYETQAYQRHKVSLVSKKTAWVFTATE